MTQKKCALGFFWLRFFPKTKYEEGFFPQKLPQNPIKAHLAANTGRCDAIGKPTAVPSHGHSTIRSTANSTARSTLPTAVPTALCPGIASLHGVPLLEGADSLARPAARQMM